MAGPHVVARAPNHLGDGVMALPALEALSRVAGRLTVQAPSWGRDLYRGLSADVVPRGRMAGGDVAVLFPPSLRVAWQALRVPRRIGTPTDRRRWLLTDVVGEGSHRRDTYASLAAAVGATVGGEPRWHSASSDSGVTVPPGHIGLNPISVSGAVVQWTGYADLAAVLDRPVVFYGGPGEGEQVCAVAGAHPQRVGLPLPAFGQALRHCAVFVTNDSGAAHFARACGVPTVVVYGSTVPERTGPSGAVAVQGPALACRPCYAKRCERGLACLDIEVARVAAAVEQALEAGHG